MAMQPRRLLQLGLGLVLSALFLYLALRDQDWGGIGSHLAAADYRYVALMLPLGVYGLYARSQRWRLLLEASNKRPVPILPVFSASAIGFMANMILPLRVGEIARPLLAARGAGLPVANTLATVVLERVLDLVALATFGIGIVLVSDVPPEAARWARVAAVLAAAGFFGAILVILRREQVVPVLDRLWVRIPRVGPILLEMEHEFLDGIAPIANPSVLLRALAWSLWIWLVIAVSFALGFEAVGLGIPFLRGGITVSTIVALAVAFPSAPGFVGTFEFGCRLALHDVLGAPADLATGYALLVHATQFLTQVVMGVVFLAREGLRLGDLTGMGRSEGPQGPR